MAKKLALLGTAIALIALAAPTVASATELTMPQGKNLVNGEDTRSTSSNFTVFTEGLGTLECASVEADYELTNEGPSEVVLTSLGAGTTTGCSDEGEAITLTGFELGPIRLLSPTSGSAELSFIADLPTVTCNFSGTVPVTYVSGSSEFHMEGELEGGGCGESFAAGQQILETRAPPTPSGLVIID